MGTSERGGFNSAETGITAANAGDMALKWAVQRPKLVETQPVEANNLIYTEGNDGYEVALNLTGSLAWQQFVGTATDSCDARAHGASTTATVADETIGGNSTSVLYTGGFANGQAELYALNALSGTIIWQRPLGDSVNTDTDMWSSPLVYNGSVYVGVASASDCPLVQGKLVQMDATNGAIQNTFKATPDGCIGPGIWGSPTLDTAATSTATVSSPTTSVATSTATVYVATGNGPTSGSCSPSAPVYAESLVALNATDLRVLSSWQVPSGQQVNDGDFGSTPTLFTANMNGQQHSMVGLVNKNGIYYAFDRANLGPGPVWQTVVSVGGPSPEYGGGSVAPSAWDGSHLYVAGGTMSYGGSSCASLLQALDPSTGKSIWADCLSTGPVLGAVTAAPGIVEVGAGNA
ncbi:MAG: PQQ-binding-like beta-propeller repeat protein, partial [Chloroflexota bacterium]